MTSSSSRVEPRADHETLRSSFPLTWGDLGRFLLAFVVVTGLWTALGKLIVGPLDGSVGSLDRRVADELAAGRSESLDRLSYWGSMLAETAVKIVLTALVVIWMLRVWRSWVEPLIIAASLVLEASCFLAITLLVGRPRPDVVRLDGSPVDSSFPSGHVAAAVVYGAVVIVLHRRGARPITVTVAAVVVSAIAATVGWARMYRGMHHLSDVIAGVLLGLISLAITWWIVTAAERARRVGRSR